MGCADSPKNQDGGWSEGFRRFFCMEDDPARMWCFTLKWHR